MLSYSWGLPIPVDISPKRGWWFTWRSTNVRNEGRLGRLTWWLRIGASLFYEHGDRGRSPLAPLSDRRYMASRRRSSATQQAARFGAGYLLPAPQKLESAGPYRGSVPDGQGSGLSIAGTLSHWCVLCNLGL